MKIYQKYNDKTITEKLLQIINNIKHFPISSELSQINNNLIQAIKRNGGINKYRKLLGYDYIHKSSGYWKEESIKIELLQIISNLNHFPTTNELRIINREDLLAAINKYGGLNKFRKIFGNEYIQRPKRYWNDELITNELQVIINNISHFPTYKDLQNSNRYDLRCAIANHGGIIKFRKILKYDLIKKPNGYYTKEVIIKELKEIIKNIGHFPSVYEFRKTNNSTLMDKIRNGEGLSKFQELCGYNMSFHDKYVRELGSYIVKRGKSSEKIVKQILHDYCLLHNLSEPIYNKKLSKGNVIEFVCNTNKIVGIDVTNTKQGRGIRYKYLKKDYHKHLDELWIVVFSNTFSDQDYIKWNKEIPDNVRVMSIYSFLKELDYSLDESTKSKIDKYNQCTFHTKEEFLLKR